MVVSFTGGPYDDVALYCVSRILFSTRRSAPGFNCHQAAASNDNFFAPFFFPHALSLFALS